MRSTAASVGAEVRVRRATELEREADVVAYAAPGQQGGVLKHEGLRGPTRGAGLLGGEARDAELAARGREQAGDGAQQGRLAAAGGADERHELAAAQLEVDAVEREQAAGEAQLEVTDADQGARWGRGRGGFWGRRCGHRGAKLTRFLAARRSCVCHDDDFPLRMSCT
jgi:hypothetical protein